MSLDKKTYRWVRATIISDRARLEILEFESRWRQQAFNFVLAVLGAPVLIIGFVTAVTVAYMELSQELGFAMDLVATSMLAIGCFHVILGKLSAAKEKNVGLSFTNFMIGAGLIIVAIKFEKLSPYRTLLIWSALIMFSSLLARRLFKWLIFTTAVYMAGLYAVREILGPDPEVDPYLAVAVLMAALTPVVLFLVWSYRTTRRILRWLWNSQFMAQIIEGIKGELEKLRAWWRRVRIRSRATSIWLGKFRRFLLEFAAGGLIGVGTRKHFELLDAILWQTQSITLWCTLIIWAVLFSLLPKERYQFSMWFSFFGITAIFLHIARFSGPEGFHVTLEGTTYHTGHLTMGIFMLYCVSMLARKLVWDKKTASELFQLGPLGWITAAGLIAFVKINA